MNTNVQISMSPPVSDIARVAFSMFVHIADVDKSITAQDVRRFQALLRETSWVDSDDLRNAIHALQQNYSTFWANYEDGVFPVNIGSIAECLDRASRDLGHERASKLRRSLHRFLDRLDGGAIGVKLIQGNDQRTRLQARKELLAILDKQEEQAARANEQSRKILVETAPPPAPSQPTVLPRSEAQPVPVVTPIAPLWPAAAISPDQLPVWAGGRTKVRCVSVVWETSDTKTYSFVAEPQTLFNYKPGQFITIEVPLPGSILRRSYTISSSPSRPYTLSITVKKVPMGWMSNWLFDNMIEGFECTISGPAGKFSCHNHPSSKLLFLAAGSGITPSMSMLRWLADTSSPADIVFINNVRTPDDIIFHQELLHMSTLLSSRIRLAIVPAAVSPGRPWQGPIGRLEELLVRTYAPDFSERETFVCGPPGYMAAAKTMLAGLGLPMEQYHDESFGAAPAAASTPKAAGTPLPPARPQPAGSASTPDPNARASNTQMPSALPARPTAGVASTSAGATPLPPARPQPAGIASTPDPNARASNTQMPSALPARPTAGVASTSAGAPPPTLAPSTVRPASRDPNATRAVVPSASPATPRQAAIAAPPVAAAGSPAEAGVVRTGRISIQGRGDSFVIQPGQTILEAADRSGIALAHSCRAGVCGACKMQKVSGRVDLGEQTILSPSDIDAGYILTCVGKAVGDVTLAP
ncbi:2Fe-2S iron-sulfur cluster-binding protein [Rhizobium ruizarguesonis]